MIRLVLDTNVFISGIFWSGAPSKIINAWYDEKIKIVCSLDIIEEYTRVSSVLSKKYPNINIDSIINLIVKESELFPSTKLKEPVSRDPDDDKFIAAALTAQCYLIISGDADLLTVTGYSGIEIITPSKFVTQYL